jgi:hypothetical protein
MSNTSLINSIYLSTVVDKGRDNKDTYSDIEKFVMQYEDKIYFYDALYEYISNFINNRKIRLAQPFSKDKPQQLGQVIETILRSWLKSRKDCDLYKSKLRQLIK